MLKNINPFFQSDFLKKVEFFEDFIYFYYISVIRCGANLICMQIKYEIELIPGYSFAFESVVSLGKYFQSVFSRLILLKNRLFTLVDEVGIFLKILLLVLLLPVLIFLIFSFFIIIYSPSTIKCFEEQCIKDFFTKYFYHFKWYGEWLSVVYNVTAALGVTYAAMTYYKNNKSQASINHFANVKLFCNYVETEIEKKNKLNIASFDLMFWYSYIYPDSKVGDLKCSFKYIEAMKEYADLIHESNLAAKSKNGIGYKFVDHQIKSKKILQRIGISIKETNRIGFHEVEGELLDLITKVNLAFPSDKDMPRFLKRTYL